jgi:hypothetical protein
MVPSTLNLVPPAPFPQPLASDVDDIPPVIVDEADLPAENSLPADDPQVEPLASHPQGVDAGEAAASGDNKLLFNANDDGMIRDSLTLGELRKYVDCAAFKVKVLPFRYESVNFRNPDNMRLRTLILSLLRRKLRSFTHTRIIETYKRV